MGFGLLFLVMNILQLIVVTILLLQLYWPLGLVVLVTAVPIVMVSLKFEKKYLRISARSRTSRVTSRPGSRSRRSASG